MRADLIFKDKKYQKIFQKLQVLEAKREFCNHTLEHFLDVARLMYIKFLEDYNTKIFDAKKIFDNLSTKAIVNEVYVKDLIYATALMHDIGRVAQIEEGIPHEKASCILCDEILPKCQYEHDEIVFIKKAIDNHRCDKKTVEDYFSKLLYWADKKSRNCYNCSSVEDCNWSREKMNLDIEY